MENEDLDRIIQQEFDTVKRMFFDAMKEAPLNQGLRRTYYRFVNTYRQSSDYDTKLSVCSDFGSYLIERLYE